jgi:hypothetical protein
MMQSAQRDSERGSVTTEFVLVIPLLALAMLFLMGLGYTLMTKQNALVGARAAVYYRAPRTQIPQPAQFNELIGNAVSPGREEWAMDFNQDNQAMPGIGQIPVIGPGVGWIFGRFNKEVKYTARGSATLGFLPRVMKLDQAQGTYYLPTGTWTCEQTGGGSYTSIMFSQIGLPSEIGGLLDLSCCENYDATYR